MNNKTSVKVIHATKRIKCMVIKKIKELKSNNVGWIQTQMQRRTYYSDLTEVCIFYFFSQHENIYIYILQCSLKINFHSRLKLSFIRSKIQIIHQIL